MPLADRALLQLGWTGVRLRLTEPQLGFTGYSCSRALLWGGVRLRWYAMPRRKL